MPPVNIQLLFYENQSVNCTVPCAYFQNARRLEIRHFHSLNFVLSFLQEDHGCVQWPSLSPMFPQNNPVN